MNDLQVGSTWVVRKAIISARRGDQVAQDFTNPSAGLAAFQLSVHILLELERSNVLTTKQINELIEMSLLGLETSQANASDGSRPVLEAARLLLETLRLRSSLRKP